MTEETLKLLMEHRLHDLLPFQPSQRKMDALIEDAWRLALERMLDAVADEVFQKCVDEADLYDD